MISETRYPALTSAGAREEVRRPAPTIAISSLAGTLLALILDERRGLWPLIFAS